MMDTLKEAFLEAAKPGTRFKVEKARCWLAPVLIRSEADGRPIPYTKWIKGGKYTRLRYFSERLAGWRTLDTREGWVRINIEELIKERTHGL